MKIDDIVGLEKEEILRTLKFDNIKGIIEEIKPKPCIIYSKKSQIFPKLVKKYGLIVISEKEDTVSFENNKILLLVNFSYIKKFLGYSDLIKKQENQKCIYYKNYRG